MIIAHHIILSAYGFWLPNDPRGSWSDFVGAWELFRYGPATKVSTHRSLAKKPHDRELRIAAKRSLKYPAVRLTPTIWGRSFWDVFIDDDAHLVSAIRYVNDNPRLEGMRKQMWKFVTTLEPTRGASPAAKKSS